MSDPYIPSRGDTLGRSTAPVGPTVADRSANPYRNDLRSGTTKPVQSGFGGFGAGALVAMVFVVVAIIAAILFSYRPVTESPSGVAPAVTTVPDASPDASGADTPGIVPGTVPDGAPDATPDTTPAPVEPDTAPDLVPEPAPGDATPDTAAPATP